LLPDGPRVEKRGMVRSNSDMVVGGMQAGLDGCCGSTRAWVVLRVSRAS
jgi:hypothetical protein